MLLVIQTATIAAVGIAFAKFTAILVPWFSAEQWISTRNHRPPCKLWFGVLGPYSVGLNRQNLLAIISILALTSINTRGLTPGKIIQNVLTLTKVASLAALGLLGVFFSTEVAIKANFSNFHSFLDLSPTQLARKSMAAWLASRSLSTAPS
jgi:basic amino acid/polyamine antiporter, APA family